MLKDKVALVTGSTSGIGLAIARAFAKEGANVVINGFGEAAAIEKERAAIVADFGVKALYSGADMTKGAEIAGMVADAQKALGAVDILVNNAGGVVGQVGRPLEDVPDDDWHAVIDANLTTAFFCTRAVVPGMKERRWGRIINISSAAGLSVSRTGIQAYASAKAGQIGFTRQMAHELGPFGITVNCIAPGFILSNPTTQKQWESYGEDGQRQLMADIALRRLGKPEDIANGAAFFAAERSSWITGQTIAIDGGSAGL
jgi:3-oxoacyl-[acyl-carrier protein] reductase